MPSARYHRKLAALVATDPVEPALSALKGERDRARHAQHLPLSREHRGEQQHGDQRDAHHDDVDDVHGALDLPFSAYSDQGPASRPGTSDLLARRPQARCCALVGGLFLRTVVGVVLVQRRTSP